MKLTLPTKKASPFTGYAVKHTCGHVTKDKGWVYDKDDALKLYAMLERRPCDNCMVAMTKINNYLAEVMDAQQ